MGHEDDNDDITPYEGAILNRIHNGSTSVARRWKKKLNIDKPLSEINWMHRFDKPSNDIEFDYSSIDGVDKVGDALRPYVDTLKSFAKGPVNYVLNIVYGNIIQPLYRGLLRGGAVIIGVVALVFLGSDCSLGQTGGTCNIPYLKSTGMFDGGQFLGIADIPLWVADLLIDTSRPLGDSLLTPIHAVNSQIGAAVSSAGLPAPAILAVLQMVELAVGLYGLSLAIQFALGYVAPGLAPRLGKIIRAPLRWIS